MDSSVTLLGIIESNKAVLLDRIAQNLRESGRATFEVLDVDGLSLLAWSHLDPIVQSLRYDDDYLFDFFLEYSSHRNAEAGLPIDASLFTISSVREALWEIIGEQCPQEEIYDVLRRLDSILGKAKDGIAASYVEQRDSLLGELRLSNTKLMEMAKHKLDFLAKVSHELKTPLTSVLAYTEQLQNPDLPPDVRQEFIDVVHGQGKKLKFLIDDLLDFSKQENEHSRMNMQRADLRRVLQEAVDTVQTRADAKAVKLILEPGDELPELEMDAFRIQQVVWNLLTNAVKYNRPEGEVRISATRNDAELLVCVRDNGLGIASEDLERIFSSFQQTSEAIASNEGGAGLGLDIVQHFIELHGGKVWVESELGKGSVFRFNLPLEHSPGTDTGEPPHQQTSTVS